MHPSSALIRLAVDMALSRKPLQQDQDGALSFSIILDEELTGDEINIPLTDD